jgi:hypothetical protein
MVVAWKSPDGIAVRRFDAAGAPLGATHHAPVSEDLSALFCPQVSINGSGAAVAVWVERLLVRTAPLQSTRVHKLYAQRFAPSGAPAGVATEVLSRTDSSSALLQRRFEIGGPEVAIGDDGGYAITWNTIRTDISPVPLPLNPFFPTPAEIDTNRIRHQAFDADGTSRSMARTAETVTATGADLGLNSIGSRRPEVAMSADGQYVVAWDDNPRDRRIKAQRYRADGKAMALPFRADPILSSARQSSPAIALNEDGELFIAWQSLPNTSGEEATSRIRISAFGSDGRRADPLFTANRQSGPSQAPRIVVDAQGRLAAAWTEVDSGNQPARAVARYLTADGSPLSPIFPIAARVRADDIAVDGRGQLVGVWSEDFEIRLQRFEGPDGP